MLLGKVKKVWGLDKTLLAGISSIALILITSLLMASPDDSSQVINLDPPPAIEVQQIQQASSANSLLPDSFHVRLQRNENLVSLFGRLLLPESEITSMLSAMPSRERAKLNRLSIGTDIYLSLDEDEKLRELIVMHDIIKGSRYHWVGSGKVAVSAYEAEYHKEHKYTSGTIGSSLYQDGINQGLSGRLILNFADIFAYDIDFANDVRAGDSFSMLLEDLFVEDRIVKEDTISVAEFVNQGESVLAIRYTNNAGEIGYFTPKGESMQSRFLRMPIHLARITSRFNPNRRHPVLKIVRPHKGVDFGARRGTPVIATGNGRVKLASYNGGYGRTVILNHGDGYTTLYAHLNRYARGLRRGISVKQGQVIGYVGTTGVSTGPHLHYEFRINGRHRDPLKVKFARSLKLDKKELAAFLAYSEEMLEKYYKYRDAGTQVVTKVN